MNSDIRPDPSRRAFISQMVATGAVMMAPEALFAVDEIDPRVAGILAKYIAVDMHAHAPVKLLETGKAEPANDPVLDLAGEAKRSGFGGLCFTYALDSLDHPKSYYNAHVQSLDQIDRMLARQQMKRVFNLKQLEEVHKSGGTGIIQTAEGAQFIEGKLERVEEAYRRGMRHLQFVHHDDNPGAPIGDSQNMEKSIGGLTDFGVKVLNECNRLHMVVDLAHGGPAMVEKALKVSSQPFVVSHTALNSPAGRAGRLAETSERTKGLYTGAGDGIFNRLLTPAHAKAVASAGGLVGVWHLFPSMKDFVGGIKEMVDTIGVDHVGIGTDTSLVTADAAAKTTNKYFPDQKAGFMVSAANEMLKQGFSPDDVGKIAGGNYCKLFGKITGDRA